MRIEIHACDAVIIERISWVLKIQDDSLLKDWVHFLLRQLRDDRRLRGDWRSMAPILTVGALLLRLLMARVNGTMHFVSSGDVSYLFFPQSYRQR